MSTKQVFFISWMMLVASTLSAQDWGQNNPVWHYEQTQYMPGSDYGYHRISILGDTVISGDTAKIFWHEYLSPVDTSYYFYYMRTENQKVYMYSSELEDFKLLYDFGAETGDTLEIWADYDGLGVDSFKLHIDSTSTILLNGISLKTQYVSQIDYWGVYYMAGKIIEGIGWEGYMFPQNGVMDPPFGGDIRCFEDNRIGLYQFTALACDFVGVESPSELVFQLYPNPVTSTLTITPAEISQIPNVTIYSSTGQYLANYQSNTIDFHDYPTGIYFVRITHLNSSTLQKVVKL